MFFLSDKLWLTANNSKGFANRSKLMIRNLGLRKCTEICLIKNIVMDLMLSKYRFGKKDISKKLMIFGKDTTAWWKKAISEKNEAEVSTLLDR